MLASAARRERRASGQGNSPTEKRYVIYYFNSRDSYVHHEDTTVTTKTDAPLSGDLTLNEITSTVPRALEVFNRYGLDSCCGGAKPLGLVCERHGLDLEKVLGDIQSVA